MKKSMSFIFAATVALSLLISACEGGKKRAAAQASASTPAVVDISDDGGEKDVALTCDSAAIDTACGGVEKKTATVEVTASDTPPMPLVTELKNEVISVGGLTFDRVVVDTTVILTSNDDGVTPKCRLELNILYAKGAHAQMVNDSIIASGIISPDVNVRKRINAFMPLGAAILETELDGTEVRATHVDIPKNVEEFAAGYFDDYKNDCSDWPPKEKLIDYGDYFRDYIVNTSVVEGRNGGVTYVIEGYIYTGGAHGMHFTEAMNFDLAAGKELAYGDVFTEEGEGRICEAIVKDIMRRYGEGHGRAEKRKVHISL